MASGQQVHLAAAFDAKRRIISRFSRLWRRAGNAVVACVDANLSQMFRDSSAPPQVILCSPLWSVRARTDPGTILTVLAENPS